MKIDTNFSGVTLLKDWWKQVKSNFEDILSGHEEHRTQSTLDHPDKSVMQRHIADKAVGTSQLADYSVGSSQLAQYAVSSAKIYPAAVQTAHIKDASVTSDKIADSAVDSSKLEKYTRWEMLNSMNTADTYKETSNAIGKADDTSLFKTYSTRFGSIGGAPSDTTENSSGDLEYLVLQIALDEDDKLQIAMNTTSYRRFIRRLSLGRPGEWTEI
jgi:hypothetical protein